MNNITKMQYSKFGNMMEKNRIESFSKWPFDDDSACSAKKVKLFEKLIVQSLYINIFHVLF